MKPTVCNNNLLRYAGAYEAASVGKRAQNLMSRPFVQKARAGFALCAIMSSSAACVQRAPDAVDYGTVIQVRPAEMPADSSGLGALGGAGVGGLVGSQFGGGAGAAAATLAGVIAGAIAGSATEGALQDASGLEYTLSLANGKTMTIVQHRDAGDRILNPGERALLQTNGRYQRVVPAE